MQSWHRSLPYHTQPLSVTPSTACQEHTVQIKLEPVNDCSVLQLSIVWACAADCYADAVEQHRHHQIAHDCQHADVPVVDPACTMASITIHSNTSGRLTIIQYVVFYL